MVEMKAGWRVEMMAAYLVDMMVVKMAVKKVV